MKTVERKPMGKGRKNRIGVSVETEYENMLKRLAISCGMPVTTMAYVLLKKCLDSGQVIAEVQRDFSPSKEFHMIRTVDEKGKPRLELFYSNK